MINSDRSHSWVKMNGNELLCIQFLYQITVSDVCTRQLCQGFVPDHCVRCLYCDMCCTSVSRCTRPPQWGAADAEIKVPSGEDTELKRSPFQAWSRSVYSHTCYAYCQGFLPCLFLHFLSIHLHFFQNLSRNVSCVLAVANTWFLCRPAE